MALNLIFDITDRATPQTKKLQRELNNLNASVKNTSKTFLGFDRSLVTAVGSFVALDKAIGGGKLFIETADSLNLVNSRLKLVTDSTEEFTKAQVELFNISQNARVSLTETVDLYARLARTTKNVSISQDELLRITETINKTLIISGASAESANAALVQLGQGLAADALRGQELNSVMEQTPRLAEALAKGLGVGLGDLRKLAEQGVLTAETVTTALSSQAKAVDTEFDKMSRTVSQSWVNITNSATLAVGKFDDVSGSTASLAESMKDLSTTIDSITTEDIASLIDGFKFAGNVAVGLGAGIVGTTVAFKAYNVINALVGAQNVKTAFSFNAVGQSVRTTTISTNALSVSMRSIPFVAVASSVALLATTFLNTSETAEELQGSYEDMSRSLEGLTRNQLEYRQSLVETELAQKRLQLSNLKADVANVGLFESDEEIKKDRARLDEVRQQFRDLQKISVEIKDTLSGNGSKGLKIVDDEESEKVKNLRAEMQRLVEQLGGKGKESKVKFFPDAQEARDQLQQQRDDMFAFADELRDIGKSSTQLELEQLNERFEANKSFIEQSSELYANYTEQRKSLEQQVSDDQIQKQIERLENEGTFYAGLEALTLEYAENAKTNFDLAQESFQSFTDNASDSLFEFVTTGKTSFSDFAASVVKDITKILIKEQVTALAIKAIEAGKLAFKSTAETGKQALMATTAATEISTNTATTSTVLATETAKTSAAATTSAVSSMQGIPFPFNLAALAATIAAITAITSKGFADGGYTGRGGKFDPAGIVHKGEFVFTKEQTSDIGVNNLTKMANGDFPTRSVSGGGGVSIIINNNTSSQVNATTQTDSEGQVAVIIDIVKEDLISDIRQGNGDFSGALEGTFGLSRSN